MRVNVRLGYQSVRGRGERTKYFQYDLFPRGLVLDLFHADNLNTSSETPFDLSVSRLGDGTGRATANVGLTRVGRLLHWKFDEHKFFLDRGADVSERRHHGGSLLLPLGSTTGLRVSMSTTDVVANNARSGVDVRVQDWVASTLLPTDAAAIRVSYAQREIDDRIAGPRHLQTQKSVIRISSPHDGRIRWSANGTFLCTESKSESLGLGQTATSLILGARVEGDIGPDLTCALDLRNLNNTRKAAVNGARVIPGHYLSRKSTALGTLTYTGLSNTTLRAGLRTADIVSVTHDGGVQEAGERYYWGEASTRLLGRVRAVGRLSQRYVSGLPVSQLSDDRALYFNNIRSGSIRLEADLSPTTTLSAGYSGERRVNPTRKIGVVVVTANADIYSQLSDRLGVSAGVYHESWRRASTDVSGFLTSATGGSMGATYQLGRHTSLDASYSLVNISGAFPAEEEALELSASTRIADGWKAFAEFGFREFLNPIDPMESLRAQRVFGGIEAEF